MLSAPPTTGGEDALGMALVTLQMTWMLYVVLSFVWEVCHAPRHHRG